MENQESKGNGFDLGLILSKAPSDEIRNEMIVDAVQNRKTNNPTYFRRAVRILEENSKLQIQTISQVHSFEFWIYTFEFS